MSSSSSSSLPFGANCPSSSQWYACGNGAKFVGCCTSNPCNSSGCPTANVRAASFDSAQFGKFGDQQCRQGAWYSCARTNPPFMGCCTSNPCSSGCPSSDLRAASLSNNDTIANQFEPNPPLGATSTTSSGRPTSTPTPSTSTSTSTSTPTATSTSPALSSRPSSKIPAIAGGAAGGAAVLIIIALLALWRWRRHMSHSRQQVRDSQNNRMMTNLNGKGSQYNSGHDQDYAQASQPFLLNNSNYSGHPISSPPLLASTNMSNSNAPSPQMQQTDVRSTISSMSAYGGGGGAPQQQYMTTYSDYPYTNQHPVSFGVYSHLPPRGPSRSPSPPRGPIELAGGNEYIPGTRDSDDRVYAELGDSSPHPHPRPQ